MDPAASADCGPCTARILDWPLTCAVANSLDAVMIGCPGALKIAYVLTGRILGLVALIFRSD